MEGENTGIVNLENLQQKKLFCSFSTNILEELSLAICKETKTPMGKIFAIKD